MRVIKEGTARKRLSLWIVIAMLLTMGVPNVAIGEPAQAPEPVAAESEAVESPAGEEVAADAPVEEPAAEVEAPEPAVEAPEKPAAEPAPADTGEEAPAPAAEAKPEKDAPEVVDGEPAEALVGEQKDEPAADTSATAEVAEDPTRSVAAAAELDALQTTEPPEPMVEPVLVEHEGPVPEECIRIDAEGPGVYVSDGVTVTIEIIDGVEYVSFVSDDLVFQVIVKGGPYGFMYTYPEGTLSDEGLHSPLVGVGNIADVSYVQLCPLGVLPPEEETPTVPPEEETPTVLPPEILPPEVQPVVSPTVVEAEAVETPAPAGAEEMPFLPFTGGPLAPIGFSSLMAALAGLALRRKATHLTPGDS